jgi:hypothetical protein
VLEDAIQLTIEVENIDVPVSEEDDSPQQEEVGAQQPVIMPNILMKKFANQVD